MKRLLLSLSLLGVSCSSFAMDSRIPTVYAIPGQNGFRCDPAYVQNVLGSYVPVVPVPTPNTFADLGQNRCMHYLRDAIKKGGNKGGILYANSQGTATALNYLADTPDHKIKALVLEATLASGNSAIHHTVTGPFGDMAVRHVGRWLDLVRKIPLSYYWLPYLAKCVFPFYWPAGKQPIKSIQNISSDMPIVIVHAQHDPQLSYKDACALYYGLRARGNNNVYFIQQEGDKHMDILESCPDTRQAVRAILGNHGVTPPAHGDLSHYQPDPAQFKSDYDNLMFKERIHNFIGKGLTVGALVGSAKVAHMMYKYLNK